jgi:PAS domain S-box-containing protein
MIRNQRICPEHPAITAETLAVINSIPAGICLVRLDGQFINANARFCEYVGYSVDELRRLQFHEITHADDRARDVEGLKSLGDGRVDVYAAEKRYISRTGRVLWVSLTSTLVRDAQGQPQYAMTVVQEIESRRRAEEALRESEMRFRTLFEQAPFSVQLLSVDGRTLQVNKAWDELWQITDPATRNYIFNDYNVLTDPQLEAKGTAAFIRRAYAGESTVIPPILYDPAEIGQSGRSRWVSAYAHPIKAENGQVREVMLIHHDVTDQIEAQSQLRNAKEAAEAASRMKSSFLANMSHEIRTPLGAILGFTELLKLDGISAKERKEYLDIIDRSGRSLTQILNDVLDLSQVEAGSVKIENAVISIQNVIAEVVNLLGVEKRKRGLFLKVEIAPDAPDFVCTDAIRLKQILINLVGNALKFTLQGGVTIQLNAPKKDSPLTIAVRDTGIGIPPELWDRLFHPFSQVDSSNTRQFGGTGLGLALCRRLAQLLGGDVVLSESVPGEGSTFVLQLPAHAGMDGEGSYPSGRHEVRGGTARQPGRQFDGLHLLIVDDSADNRLLMARLLEDQGATVDQAADGGQAIAKSGEKHFDLILMDIQMRVMDGFDATRELRRRGFTKPIIAVTAHAMMEDIQQSLDAGCTDHLPKPIDPERLIRMIAGHVFEAPASMT